MEKAMEQINPPEAESRARPVVPFAAGGTLTAIVPRSLEEAFRLAKAIALSGLAPSGMSKPEQVLVAILHGLEVGLPPMQAIQRIAVIGNRPAIWGDAIPALLLSKGFSLDERIEGEGDAMVAHCVITRPDGRTIARSFGWSDAVLAGLAGKDLYKKYRQRMLQMRARGYAARDGAADALSGLYIAEELQDAGPIAESRDITPKKATKPKGAARLDEEASQAKCQEILGYIQGLSRPVNAQAEEDFVARYGSDIETLTNEHGDMVREMYREWRRPAPEDGE